MNCSLNLVERRNRDLGWNAVALDGGEGQENLAVSRGLTPEAALLDDEALTLRERAMQRLTPMERTAFVLRHMEDQPMTVIAESLGVPVNSAKQAVFRAVAKLRQQLRPARQKSAAAMPAIALAKERA